MIRIQVHLERAHGYGVSGRHVCLSIQTWPIPTWSTWLEGYSNENGNVNFKIETYYKIEITFIVDGIVYKRDTVEDCELVVINLDKPLL